MAVNSPGSPLNKGSVREHWDTAAPWLRQLGEGQLWAGVRLLEKVPIPCKDIFSFTLKLNQEW
jgi:hypothetical protein